MTIRGSRLARTAAIVAALGAVMAAAGADLIWRWRAAVPEELIRGAAMAAARGDATMSRSSAEGLRDRRRHFLPALADDPRLVPLRRAAADWRRARGPRRQVVDLVCLVPDVPSFLEAIAAWDDRHYFPILIDEPAWVLPFLRAFRPSRVVRYTASRRAPASDPWKAAVEAVARGWTSPTGPSEVLPSGGSPPRSLGRTPPGLVLSAPDSPMLAGAVALAAGRFQPLVRAEPVLWGLEESGSDEGVPVHHRDILSLPQAWRFARRIEGIVSVVAPRYDRLGDDCDFLTIAAPWPYRYNDRVEPGPAHGIQALDDLIGRVLVGEPDARGLSASRRRWAYTGRLLGDPAASVARAMGSLFLAPERALLWDTYEPGSARSAYTAVPAAHRLGRAGVAPGGVYLAAGKGSGLANWHRVLDPVGGFGLIWINSTGGPADFSIGGGPGRPADIPGGVPSAVAMIHSFSAADPADPETIAGRWLTQGAFVYFGSVNEPYLQAFRLPVLVADLAARGVPLAAALRQGESEPLGRPWRLIYLGDPLYRLPAGPPAGRLDPESWRQAHADSTPLPTADVEVPAAGPPTDPGLCWLWCLDAAVNEAAGLLRRSGPDWRSALLRIPRDRLDPGMRTAFDELIADVLSLSGRWDELHARLSRIPPMERRPRVRAAMEAGAMFRLARAARDPDARRRQARIVALRDEIRRTAWPPGSPFPRWFAERVP